MKRRFLLASLVVGVALTISRLAAQDVIVTDPAWWDPENPPADQPPRFIQRPKPDFPDELKQPEQVAYAILVQRIDENGARSSQLPSLSNPFLEGVFTRERAKFAPAKREGKSAATDCWYAVIFNPRSASVDGSDVSPRLLAVAPVALEKSQLPSEIKSPTVIWATLAIDEKGQLQKFEFDDLAYEKVRPQVEGALHFWRFAPARRTGEPVAAALRVPLILDQPFRLITPDIPPKVIHREHPDYPLAMGESGLRGEVLMEFIVDKDGSVKNPIVKQTNNPGFNEAAIEALMKWRFEPGFKRGKAVCARMQQLFMFDLNGSGGRDFVTVTAPSKKKQQQLPPEFQYDVAPKPSGVLEPVYPYALLRDRIKGSATVAFLVNSKGEVGQLVVTAASKPEFGLAVAAAIEAFQFTPGLKAGQPTNAGLKIEQEFDYSGFGNVDAGRGAALLSIEKKHPEKILSAKKLDKPLQPLSRRPPVFPISLLGRLDRGSATAEVLIDEEGKVCLPRIVKATDPAFGYAAVQAVIDWRFEPPTVGGKPVVVRVQVPFEFTLPRQGDDAAKRADKAEGRQQ